MNNAASLLWHFVSGIFDWREEITWDGGVGGGAGSLIEK